MYLCTPQKWNRGLNDDGVGSRSRSASSFSSSSSSSLCVVNGLEMCICIKMKYIMQIGMCQNVIGERDEDERRPMEKRDGSSERLRENE